jgi:hypothetical protein
MNAKLLKEIKRVISAKPERIAMGQWLAVFMDCDTVGCIAGWAAVLVRSKRRGYDEMAVEVLQDRRTTKEQARKALRLTHGQAERLFHVGEWPREFEERYVNLEWDRYNYNWTNAQLDRERADCVCQRIDAFIESKGRA